MTGNKKVAYSYDGLKKLIDDYEAVSFDIFDTLVMRTVYFNHDVFRVVGEKYRDSVPDFFNVRVLAEKELSKTSYPDIEKIYCYIEKSCRISHKLAKEIMDYEIEVERRVIIARRDIVEIFNYCKKSGKRVYIVSDMYIRKKELEKIINDVGIVGYDKIFVSCEYDTAKHQNLFKKYKNEIKAQSYLHIGDDMRCDIESSARYGIDGFRLMTSAEIWESMGGRAAENFDERSKQAIYISEKYNSPFSAAG